MHDMSLWDEPSATMPTAHLNLLVMAQSYCSRIKIEAVLQDRAAGNVLWTLPDTDLGQFNSHALNF